MLYAHIQHIFVVCSHTHTPYLHTLQVRPACVALGNLHLDVRCSEGGARPRGDTRRKVSVVPGRARLEPALTVGVALFRPKLALLRL